MARATGRPPARRVLAVVAGIGCLSAPLPASSEERLAFEGHRLVSDERLASMRGGFVGSIGGRPLELSFGIERIVSIEGEIVAATSFRIPSLASLEGLRALPQSALQSGPGNQISADVRAAGASLALIQNTLDNQVLRQVTTINASVRNLDLFRASQLGAAINRQIIESLR